MSVVKPVSASESDGRVKQPSFHVVLRGYHRGQVQAFIQNLASHLAAERQRGNHSERAMAEMRLEIAALKNQPPSFEHLGAEAARVLEQAGSSAKFLIDEARNRGETMVQEAEVEAAELIEKAQQHALELEKAAGARLAEATGERDRILADIAAEADQLRDRAAEEARSTLERANVEAERIRAAAVDEQSAMEAETERLRESRNRMLEYFGRLHSDLGELLAEASEGQSAAGSAPDAATDIDAEPEAAWTVQSAADDASQAQAAVPQPAEASPSKKH